MRKSVYSIMILAVLFGLVVSACAAPKVPSSAPTPAPTPERSAPLAPQLTREQKLVEGAKKEGEVSLWVLTIDERDNLVGLFQARYPFLKLKIWDGSSGELMAKLGEEAKVGRVSGDVVILSTAIADAHEKGLLTGYDFPNTAGWTNQPTHKYYRAIAASLRGVGYNTNLVSPAEVPRTWDDVKSTKWAGKTFAATSSIDLPMLWAYLWRENDKLNWDKSFAFWGDFFRNTRPKSGGGYGGAYERLAAGEAALLPANITASPLRLLVKGAPVGIAAPLGVSIGNGMAVGLVKDAPHPNGAQLLIDFLTTPEGLLAYADPTFFLALDPKLEGKSRVGGLLKSFGVQGYDLMPYELMTAENLQKSYDFWQKAMGLRG